MNEDEATALIAALQGKKCYCIASSAGHEAHVVYRGVIVDMASSVWHTSTV